MEVNKIKVFIHLKVDTNQVDTKQVVTQLELDTHLKVDILHRVLSLDQVHTLETVIIINKVNTLDMVIIIHQADSLETVIIIHQVDTLHKNQVDTLLKVIFLNQVYILNHRKDILPLIVS